MGSKISKNSKNVLQKVKPFEEKNESKKSDVIELKECKEGPPQQTMESTSTFQSGFPQQVTCVNSRRNLRIRGGCTGSGCSSCSEMEDDFETSRGIVESCCSCCFD